MERLAKILSLHEHARRISSSLRAVREAFRRLQELRKLAIQLRKDPSRVDVAIQFAETLRDNGFPLEIPDPFRKLIKLDNWCLTTDPHTRSLEPFIFLHIPKTAGSVVRLIVSSLFDQDRIFPHYNYPDYDSARSKSLRAIRPGAYGVFIGHMWWDAVDCIEKKLKSKATIFTIFRDPVSHYRSQIAFTDRMLEQGIRETVENGVSRDLAQQWDPQARQRYGTVTLESQATSLLANAHPLFKNMGSNSTFDAIRPPTDDEFNIALKLLNTRLDAIIFGLFEEMRESLDLLSKRLSLPFQPLITIKLNESGANHDQQLSAAQIEEVERRRGFCFDLDREARARFAARHNAAFDHVIDIRSSLNDAYRAALLEKLRPHWCVRLTADRAWPGFDWGPRESNEHNQYWRSFGPSGSGTIIVRLHPACNYLLVMVVHTATERAMTSVSAAFNGVDAGTTNLHFAEGRYILKWHLEAAHVPPSGVVEITLSQQLDDTPDYIGFATIEISPV